MIFSLQYIPYIYIYILITYILPFLGIKMCQPQLPAIPWARLSVIPTKPTWRNVCWKNR